MPDCSNPGSYDVLRLEASFDGQEHPWTHPLALNGRRLARLSLTGPLPERVAVVVNGVRYVPARERDWEVD